MSLQLEEFDSQSQCQNFIIILILVFLMYNSDEDTAFLSLLLTAQSQ